MLKPLKPLQPLQPLQPVRAVESLNPVQPLQPFSGYNIKYTSNKAKGYRDPYAIDSLSDIFVNTEGRRVQIAKHYGLTTYDMNYLSQVVLAGMGMLKEQYAEPIIKGDFFRAGYNALGSLAEDIDLVSNMTKGAIVESGSELPSLVIGGLAALAAGTATVMSGGTLGMAYLAANALGGLSATVTALMNNPEDAMRGIIRGSGLGKEGRHYYTFDIETGNPVTDYIANVAAEIAIDPLNWGSFTARFMHKAAYQLGWSISDSTLAALKLFEKADRLITGIAFYGNPLTGSLKAVVSGTRFIKSLVARQAVESAMTYAANMTDTKIDMINSVLNRHEFVKDHTNKILRKYARTGELSFVTSKNVSEKAFDWYTRFAKYLERAGMSGDKVPEFIRFYMEGLWYEDPTFYGKLLESIPEKFQDIIASFGKEFFSVTGTSAGIIKHYKTGGLESAQKAVGVFLDSLIDTGSVGNLIRNTVEMDMQGIAAEIVKKIGGFDALNKMTYKERLPYIYQALVERFPEEFADTKLASLDKNSLVYKILDRMANELGTSLDEVISYRMTINEVLYSPSTMDKALRLLSEADPDAAVVMPRKLGYTPLAQAVTEASTVVQSRGSSDFLQNMFMEIMFKAGKLDPDYNPEHRAFITAFQAGEILPFKDIMEQYGIKVGNFEDKEKQVFDNILNDIVAGNQTTETVAIQKWLDNVERLYPAFKKIIDSRPAEFWKDQGDGMFDADVVELLETFRDFYVVMRYQIDKKTPLKPSTRAKLFELYAKMNDKKFLKKVRTMINAGFGLPGDPDFEEFFLVRPEFGVRERAAVDLHEEGKYVLQVNRRAASLDIFQRLSSASFNPNDAGEVRTIVELFDALSDTDKEPVARLLAALATLDLENTPYVHITKAAKILYRQIQGYKHYGQLISSVEDLLNTMVKRSTGENIPEADRKNYLGLKIYNKGSAKNAPRTIVKSSFHAPLKNNTYTIHKGPINQADAAIKVIDTTKIKSVPPAMLKEAAAKIAEVSEQNEAILQEHTAENKEFEKFANKHLDMMYQVAEVAVKNVADALDTIPDHEMAQDFRSNAYLYRRSRDEYGWQDLEEAVRVRKKFLSKEGKAYKFYRNKMRIDLGIPGEKSIAPPGHMRFSITKWKSRPAYKGIIYDGVEHSTTETYLQLRILEIRMSNIIAHHIGAIEGQDVLSEEVKAEQIANEQRALEEFLSQYPAKKKAKKGFHFVGAFEALNEFLPDGELTITFEVIRNAVKKYFKALREKDPLTHSGTLFAGYSELPENARKGLVNILLNMYIPRGYVIDANLKKDLKETRLARTGKLKVPEKTVTKDAKFKSISPYKFPINAVRRFVKAFSNNAEDMKKATQELFKDENGVADQEMMRLAMENKNLNNKKIEPELTAVFAKIKAIGYKINALPDGSPEKKALKASRDKMYEKVRELRDLFTVSDETRRDVVRHGFLYFVGQNPNYRNAIMNYTEEELIDIYGSENYEMFIAPTRGYLALFFPDRVINADPTVFYEPNSIIWDSGRIGAYMGLNKFNNNEASDLFVAIMLNDPKIKTLTYNLDGPLLSYNGNKKAFETMRITFQKDADHVKAIIRGPDGRVFATLGHREAGRMEQFENPFDELLRHIRSIRSEEQYNKARGLELSEGHEYLDFRLRKRLEYSEELVKPKPTTVLGDGFGEFLKGHEIPSYITNVHKYIEGIHLDIKKAEEALRELRITLNIPKEMSDADAAVEVAKILRNSPPTAPFGKIVAKHEAHSLVGEYDHVPYPPKKIISGGQTGGDQGGLIAGKKLGLDTGGLMPKGFRTQLGDRPQFATEYGMTEDDSDDYKPRTMKNVDAADATIAFLWNGSKSIGTRYTIGYAQTGKWVPGDTTKVDGHKPVLVITTRDVEEAAIQIRDFLNDSMFIPYETLNIAGERESKAPGLQNFVAEALERVLGKKPLPIPNKPVNSKFEPIPGHPVKVINPAHGLTGSEAERLNSIVYNPKQRADFKRSVLKLASRDRRHIYDHTLAGLSAMNRSFKFNKDGSFDVEVIRFEDIDRKKVVARYGSWFFTGMYNSLIIDDSYRRSNNSLFKGAAGAGRVGGSNEIVEKFNFKNPYIARFHDHAAVGFLEELYGGMASVSGGTSVFRGMYQYIDLKHDRLINYDIINAANLPRGSLSGGTRGDRLDALLASKNVSYDALIIQGYEPVVIDLADMETYMGRFKVPIDVIRKWVVDIIVPLYKTPQHLEEIAHTTAFILGTRMAVWHARRLGYDGIVSLVYNSNRWGNQESGFKLTRKAVNGAFASGSIATVDYDTAKLRTNAEPKLEHALVNEVISLLEANDTPFPLPTEIAVSGPLTPESISMHPLKLTEFRVLESYNFLNYKTSIHPGMHPAEMDKMNFYIIYPNDFSSVNKIYEDISEQKGTFFLIQNMIDKLHHHNLYHKMSPFRIVYDDNQIDQTIIDFFEQTLIPAIVEGENWAENLMKEYPEAQGVARYQTVDEYKESVLQAEARKKAQELAVQGRKQLEINFPKYAEYFQQLSDDEVLRILANPSLPLFDSEPIDQARMTIDDIVSKLWHDQHITEEQVDSLLGKSEREILDALREMLKKDSIVENPDGSLEIPPTMDVLEFETHEEPMLSKETKALVFNTLLNQLEGNHMLNAQEYIDLYSPEKIASRIMLIPGMEGQEELAKALGDVVYRYLELQAEIGANVIDLPGSNFAEALSVVFDSKMGVDRLLDVVDRLETQKGFSAAAVEEFVKKFVVKQGESEYVQTASVLIAHSTAMIELLNEATNKFYIDMKNVTTNDLLNIANEVGLESFTNNPEFAAALARYIRTGVPFEDKLAQTERELNERDLLNNPGVSYADIAKRHERLVRSQTVDPDREIRFLKEQEAFREATLDNTWVGDPAKEDIVYKYIKSLHANNDYAYELVHNLFKFLKLNTDAGRTFDLAANFKTFDSIKFEILRNMDSYTLAQFMHHSTHGVLSISRKVMNGLDFHPQILSEVKEYGVEILAEDRNYLWLHVSDPSMGAKLPKPTTTYSANEFKHTPIIAQLQDYLQAHSANILPFHANLGGTPRINGESFALFGLDHLVLTEEQARQLIVNVQYSGESRVMILGEYNDYRALIERNGYHAPGSPASMIRSSIFSVINHTNAKTVYLKHVFSPDLRPSKLFSTDPKVAHKMFVSNKQFRAIALAGTEVVDVTHLVRQGPKQMQWAFDNGVVITTWSGMVNLYKKTNHFEMPKILDWWNKTVMSMYRAAFITFFTGLRNMVFDNPPRLLGFSKGDFDILGYLPKAVRMDGTFTEVMRKLGTFTNFEEFRAAYFKLTPEEQKAVNYIQMIIQSKIINNPLEGLLEITKDSRIEKITRGLDLNDANTLQKIVWSNPSTMAGVMLMTYGERIYRLAAIMYGLDNGMELPEITDEVLKYFLDYDYRPKSVRILNLFIPFGIFAAANTAMWADTALENPYLLRIIIQASTEGFIDENHRKKKDVARFEAQQALSGNFQIGQQIFKSNPSFFDAIGLALNIAENPQGRAMPVIRDLPGFLSGNGKSIEMPFEGEMNKYSQIIQKAMSNQVDDISDVAPWFAFSPSGSQRYPRTTRSTGYSRTPYSLYTGYGAGKMASRYGGVGMRSSNFARKVYIDRGFYSTLYTKKGKSRLGIRANTKPTYKNLAARIKDQSYMFR